MLISVCIPCYNSSKIISIVIENVKNEILKRGDNYQFVLVNDGSIDNTFGVIRELCNKDKNIVGIDLTKNFGQAQAKMCALRHTNGDVVIFMDDDGQHDPKDLYKFVDSINNGYDVVYGKIIHKKHNLFKNITSIISHYIQEKIGNFPIGIATSSYAAYSKLVANTLQSYSSPFVAMGPFLLSVTNKFINVEINHKERLIGHSGYTIKKLFKLWIDVVCSFSMVPLRIATFLGLFFSITGFIGATLALVLKLVKKTVLPGYTSTIIILFVMTGVILIILGIIGEYVGRMYMILCGMKQYSERIVLNEEYKK